MLGTAVVVLSVYYYRQITRGRGAFAAAGLELGADLAKVYNEAGELLDTGSVQRFFVSTLLTTVIIKGQRQRYIFIVFADALSARSYRHLRVWLKN